MAQLFNLAAVRTPSVVLGAVAVATLAVHFHDPHQQGAWGYCPSYYLFGIYCPGCGGLRAVNDLSNFQLAAAAHSNLLFVLFLPFILGWFSWWAWRSWTGRNPALPPVSRWVWMGAFGLMLLFGLLRNLPFADFLQPPPV